MIISLPQKEPSGEVKVAAVEVSLASFFAAIQDFSFGVHSYAFLVKRINGEYLTESNIDRNLKLELNQTFVGQI